MHVCTRVGHLSGSCAPPCGVQDWLAGPARLTNKPEDEDRVLSLHDVCTALSFLHSRDLVHGALGSEAAMWFEGPRRWGPLCALHPAHHGTSTGVVRTLCKFGAWG